MTISNKRPLKKEVREKRSPKYSMPHPLLSAKMQAMSIPVQIAEFLQPDADVRSPGQWIKNRGPSEQAERAIE